MKNPFKALNKFELILWIISFITVSASFLIAPERDYLTLLASLIGVTTLIFVAKGLVIGQVLGLIFAVFYGIISLIFGYYGETITYLGMSAPMAVISIISWIKHPYKNSDVVEIGELNGRKITFLLLSTTAVTVGFYFILCALGTENLIFSTVSVATSFSAVSLTYLRSPYYALAYAANDVVLIVLWSLATAVSISYLPMIFCFAMFLINDLYGFINWQRMRKSQAKPSSAPKI